MSASIRNGESAMVIVDDDERRRRDRLVTTLVSDFDLLGVTAEACRNAGIPNREQQVAYCLVVLSDKRDPVRSSALRPASRTYELDIAADCFADRLGSWAATIARNMRDWSTVYEAIHREFDRYEIATLRSLIRVSAGDDVIVSIADKLGAVISGGQRLEDMTVDLARQLPRTGADYVFQSPLPRWVTTSAKRATPWATDPIEPHEEEIAGSHGWTEVVRELELRDELDHDIYRQLVERVGGLADTRGLLPAAIEHVDTLDRAAARSRLASAADISLLHRLRAELAHVTDELLKEQRAFGGMLAYIVLAMRSAPRLQGVTILSLRVASLERPVIDYIAAMMRAVIDDEQQPTPALISKVQEARQAGVSRNRAKAIERLRDAPDARAAELAAVVRLLETLPPTVGDIAAIGSALPNAISASNVATTRGHAITELIAVDVWFGRVFRRYATGPT